MLRRKGGRKVVDWPHSYRGYTSHGLTQASVQAPVIPPPYQHVHRLARQSGACDCAMHHWFGRQTDDNHRECPILSHLPSTLPTDCARTHHLRPRMGDAVGASPILFPSLCFRVCQKKKCKGTKCCQCSNLIPFLPQCNEFFAAWPAPEERFGGARKSGVVPHRKSGAVRKSR